MARARNAEEARQALLDAAERFIRVRHDAVVVVATGRVDVLRSGPAAAPPEDASAYDAAILAALTGEPQTSRRLARAAGHNFNSWFRERLSRLVEANRVRRTRRGYSRP